MKFDPRDPGVDGETAKAILEKYKTTRFVPELVLVAPDGEFLLSIPLEDLAPDRLADHLRKAAGDAGG